MKKKLISFIAVAALLFSVFTITGVPVEAANVKQVTATSLTVRSGPSTGYKAIGYLQKGTNITVLGTTNSWDKISYNGKTGYVHNGYLKSVTTSSSTSSTYKKVSAASLTMRTGPAVGYKAIGYLKQGTNVQVLATATGTWVKVNVNGTTGYVNGKYLTATVVNTPTVSVPTGSIKYVNSSDGLNIRSGRSYTYSLVGVIPDKAQVTVSDIQNGWGYVVYGTKKGYVNVSYLTSTKPSTSTPIVGRLAGKEIVLDPGHGGKFKGARGYVAEEQVNLEIALKVRTKLQAMGATVIMTRTTDTHLNSVYDYDLIARPQVAIKNNSDMFVSIHANSAGPTANGSETYYYNANRGDLKLATAIYNELKTTGGMNGRFVKYGNFSVIRNSGKNIPSTLVETGFVSNYADALKLGSASSQDKLAQAIANGIANYYK